MGGSSQQGGKRGLTPEAVLWLPRVHHGTLIHRERLRINTPSKTRIHHWAVENYNAIIPLHTPIRMAKNTTSGKHSHTLMERMQNDKAFFGNGLAINYKTKHTLTI